MIMAKRNRRTTLKNKLMLLAKDFVKRRDNYTCQRCSRQVYRGNCHASHVIPISADGRLSFEPWNMKVLCYRCHAWWHEHPCESGMWFREEFADRWGLLEQEKLANRGKGTIPLGWLEERIDWFEHELEVYNHSAD